MVKGEIRAFGCQWSGRRERPGQAGAEIETGAQRLARRAGERCAQRGRLRAQRSGRIRRRRREAGRSGGQRRWVRGKGRMRRERTRAGRVAGLKISYKARDHRQTRRHAKLYRGGGRTTRANTP